jgi:hypothetical protein
MRRKKKIDRVFVTLPASQRKHEPEPEESEYDLSKPPWNEDDCPTDMNSDLAQIDAELQYALLK